MKIKQASMLADVLTSTIRYHEQRGLLPSTTRNSNGYREYTEQDVIKIKLIKFCQSLGFNLTEIAVLLNEEQAKDHEKILFSVSEKQAELKVVIEQMNQKLMQLSRLEKTLADSWNAGQCLTTKELQSLMDDIKDC